MTRAALFLCALFLGSIAIAAPPIKVVHTTRTEQVDRGKATYETGKFDGRAYNKRVITMHNVQTTRGVIDGKPFARTEKVEPYFNEVGGGGTRVTVEGHMDGVAFKKVTTRAAMPGSMGGGYGYKVEGAEPAMP